MFSDVGQGAVIILAGVIGTMIMRRRRKKAGGLFPLFIWCGGSSVLFGLLFGSYFGMSWAPALLFDFHGIVSGEPHGQSMVNDLFDILAIAIWFGIGIISVGLLFNWLNLARKRSWLELLVTQRGLAGGWMFGGGVYAAWYMVKHGYSELPETGLLLLLVGVPAAVLFLKPTVFRLARGGSGQGESSGGVLNLIMEGIVEILEVFSGYLSNSLSFLRVAGLGIAHASLMIAFFELARMASTGGGYGVGAIVILIMGNLLVIGLEGLSAGVQALRLNYYEFFTKFFRTSGSVYRPISMK
jgi:V/A-type H+-transporting ATPase subunit I